MIRNLLVFALFATSSCVVLYGQQTPEVKKQPGEAPKAFAWSFDGDGSYLGVQTQEVTKENFGKFGLRDVRGVAVEKVLDNSPAQAAGLQNGDVIVRFQRRGGYRYPKTHAADLGNCARPSGKSDGCSRRQRTGDNRDRSQTSGHAVREW